MVIPVDVIMVLMVGGVKVNMVRILDTVKGL